MAALAMARQAVVARLLGSGLRPLFSSPLGKDAGMLRSVQRHLATLQARPQGLRWHRGATGAEA